MTLKGLTAAIAVALLATGLSAAPASLPQGWIQTGEGTALQSCKTGVRDAVGAPTPKVFQIECGSGLTGFVTVMQTISATRYAGHRVRLRAQVHGQGNGQMQLWMRADSPDKMGVAFDNMADRPLRGTFSWRSADVVLDVPADATQLAFGYLQIGSGVAEATQYDLQIVPPSVPVTGLGAQLVDVPRNLSPQ